MNIKLKYMYIKHLIFYFTIKKDVGLFMSLRDRCIDKKINEDKSAQSKDRKQ